MRVNLKFFFQPLDQFDVYNFLWIFEQNTSYYILSDLYLNCFFCCFLNIFFFSNILFFLMVLFFIFYIFSTIFFIKNLKLVFLNMWQYLYEKFFYNFILSILLSQVGKRAQLFFIYVNNLFFFILGSNLLGLVPFSYTLTSHIVLTFMLGASTLIGLTIIGFIKQDWSFLNLFIPSGVPNLLLPLLVFIEIVSYIARGFSLAIRLFANLMSGHSLIHILLFFITKILNFNFILGFIGLFLILVIFLLEIGISFLQAYVFVVLVSIYLKDSFEVGH